MGSGRRERRRPIQSRARRRRQQILDATARLLERVGFAATNTNAVAREAGASVGTVYEYFPNKEALYRALLEQYRQQLGGRITEALGAGGFDDGAAVLDRIFDAFVEFYRSQPGYRELWLGSQITDVLLETGQQWGSAFADDLAPALGLIAPALAPERRRVVTKAALHLVSAVVTAGLQAGGAEEAAMIEEARAALHRYLAPHLGPVDRRAPPG